MLRPRLLDLLSRRWYSIGDCKAGRQRNSDDSPTAPYRAFYHLNWVSVDFVKNIFALSITTISSV